MRQLRNVSIWSSLNITASDGFKQLFCKALDQAGEYIKNGHVLLLFMLYSSVSKFSNPCHERMGVWSRLEFFPLTDEVQGESITEFVAARLKIYVYMTKNLKITLLDAKGRSLTVKLGVPLRFRLTNWTWKILTLANLTFCNCCSKKFH